MPAQQHHRYDDIEAAEEDIDDILIRSATLY